MMEKYLKPKQYYIDFYDKITVDKGRKAEYDYSKALVAAGYKKGAKLNEKMRAIHGAHYYIWYFEAGERYLKKESRIKELMDADQRKDELLKNAQPLTDIYCNECNSRMDVEMKTLDISINENEPDRVLFIFRCTNKNCRRGRGLYENGEERKNEFDYCEKCNGQVEVKHNKTKDKIVSIYTCLACSHVKTYELDIKPAKKEKPDKYYNEDRIRFCLDEKRGQEYLDGKLNMERMAVLMDKIEWRDKNKDIVEKAMQINKLTLVELEKRLLPVFKKNMYVKFELSKPETIGGVRVEFTIQDAKSGRDEFKSKAQLKQLINKTLEETNWRLMSAGINYRLGILSGSLRGYESKDDLLKLVKNRMI